MQTGDERCLSQRPGHGQERAACAAQQHDDAEQIRFSDRTLFRLLAPKTSIYIYSNYEYLPVELILY